MTFKLLVLVFRESHFVKRSSHTDESPGWEARSPSSDGTVGGRKVFHSKKMGKGRGN